MERVSVPEAAQRLGISPSTVRRRVRSGELRSEREAGPNGRVWVLLDDSIGEHAAPVIEEPGEPIVLTRAPQPKLTVEVAAPSAWPTSAGRMPISLEAERAARRGASVGSEMRVAWGARERRTYRWLRSGTEARPVFGDLAHGARYADREQARAAIRIAQADAEPIQIFVAIESPRAVA